MNKKSRLIALLTILFVISLSLNRYDVSHHHGTGSGSTVAAKGTTYVCPMHPTIVQDHPGDCPICGMKLVPMKDVKTASKAMPAKTMPEPAPETPAKEARTSYKTETVYTCPMDPQVVENHPGKCPICGMNL